MAKAKIEPPAEAERKVSWVTLRLFVRGCDESPGVECHGIRIEFGIV